MKQLTTALSFLLFLSCAGFTQTSTPAALQPLIGQTIYTCHDTALTISAAPDAYASVSGSSIIAGKFAGATILTIKHVSLSPDGPTRFRMNVTLSFVSNGLPYEVAASGLIDTAILKNGNVNAGIVAAVLSEGLPTDFAFQAAQVQYPARGSSDSLMQCALGQAGHVNDYGTETQYVYNDGNLIFYVDDDTGTITNIQTFQDNE